MKSFRWRRFSDPGFLGSIKPQLLARLLAPHHLFLTGEGVSFEEDEPDYEGLIAAFTAPTETPPDDLLEALSYIDELAIDEYRDELVEAWQTHCSDADDRDLSTADFALLLWLEHRPAMERMYAEQYMIRQTRFDWYAVRSRELPSPADLTPELKAAIEAHIQRRFIDLKLGTVRVYEFTEEEDLCLVIRHGGAYEHGLKDEHGDVKAYSHRVLKHGVLIYTPSAGELAVHGKGTRAIQAFVEAAGFHLFGAKDIFIPADAPGKFTLASLVGKDAYELDCSETDDISEATFCELRWRHSTTGNHRECHSANDVFAALRILGRRIPVGVHMQSAVISYHATKSVRPRRVRIRPPCSASYERDSDASFIEPWLLKNKLMNTRFKAVGVSAQSFWTHFDERYELAATRDEWRDIFGTTHHQLAPLLVSAKMNSAAVVLKGERDVRRVVKHGDSDIAAVAEEPGRTSVPITKAHTALFRLDIGELTLRLGKSLGIEIDYEALIDLPHAWQLGVDVPTAGVRSPILLVKPVDALTLRHIVTGVIAAKLSPCVLLAPTRRTLAGEVVRFAREHSVLIAALDELLVPSSDDWFDMNHEWPALVTKLRELTLSPEQRKPVLFMTPPDAKWSDVVIRMMDFGGERVSIRVKDVTGVFTYAEMGMADGRSKKPNMQWEMLKKFVNEPSGVLAWDSRSAERQNKPYKEKLSKSLREFFRIEDDPIPYDAEAKGYRWKFTLRPHDWVR